ncbi:magnesium transporter [Rhodobacteraceae bacterium KMS-5]|uniref:Magnesium transporter n=2 Tax=Tabrizicola oligotrophica TaxID=2710650 RepID=A0A6M0QUR5_9RHOB|nr:magnesium transporter [Tabrizicola oligotrophica]
MAIAITLAGLGLDIPSLEDMEEIELSNRLYHDNGTDYLTVMVPGQNAADEQVSAPVTFILEPERLVTVRHHTPRPFDTFPARADKSGLGVATPDHVFTGLVQEIIGRLADHLEGVGRALDDVARLIYQPRNQTQTSLQLALVQIGQQGERLGRVRLALLTLGRALNHIEPVIARRPGSKDLVKALKTELRDIDALDQHANFLDSRLALTSDATLGTIDLSQNSTVKIVSLVSVLFLPPTLIASIYGMNFAVMPELAQPWGYGAALVLMVASAAVTWAVFRWKGWL